MLYRIDKGIRHKEFAKNLRKRQTRTEDVLWKYLRAKRFHGTKFRRQVPIGPYIVDFLCIGAKLVIEIDGASHATTQEYDHVRDEYLRSWGFRVIRFTNNDVLKNRASVFEKIFEHFNPSP